METVFSFVLYLVYGFFGLLLLLFVLAALFGKRVRKRREYEAEFRTMGGEEFGEFELELLRIDKQGSTYSVKARLRMHHATLEKGQTVKVYLGDTLVLQGDVTRNGRLSLRGKSVLSDISDPDEGQVCRVVWSGIEQFRAPLRRD